MVHTLPVALLLSLFLAVLASPRAAAAGNVWQSSFGQSWFYEVSSRAGELLAGTWWEHRLQPGTTYTMSFNVRNVKGRIELLLADNGAVTIDSTGSYSYDFHVSSGGKRRMVFRALTRDALASVNEISVAPRTSRTRYSGGGNWLPKGHYLSFASERNLADMQNLIDKPWTAGSKYALDRARDLHHALQTPGVRGIYMTFNWRTLEYADGSFDWRLLDANMNVARQRGLKLIVKVSDRSFDGSNVLPRYFPGQYVLWSTGEGNSGVVAKRWDPWVYNRLIRLFKAVATRYADHAGFGGIATTETAPGKVSGADYSAARYREALTRIVQQTLPALTRGKLFLYLNFLPGGESSDMNRDQRVALLRDVAHANLVVGAPDITPDVKGMPRSVTAYRLHVRRKMPWLNQLCHFQHVDQGLGGRNVKSNRYRQEYLDEVARAREHERQSWFNGSPAVFEFDDLRDPAGNKVVLHPRWVLGALWTPWELYAYAQRNFACEYVLWHYREYPQWNEYGWEDIRPVIANNPL